MRETFTRLDGRFDLPDRVLERRPDYQGAWSIGEHLEHLSLAGHFLLLTIEKGCRTALRRAGAREVEIPAGESDLELLVPVAVPGAFAWPPPAHMIPTGKVSLAEVRKELQAQKERCLALLTAMPRGEGKLCSIRMSVNQLGWLDMYQWIYFLVQHARYHLLLIDRIVTEPSSSH
ncbi:DinB family protein [Geomonas sp.]|uniref:DinB family protein n=1 Tax=Geomonas sp. TaxID=2651584 RepID=UPI002B46EA73|nr:DinB family protein [Geomonas sp.]HJV35229.1 DinB family protein [Geomonas sp.]